MQTTFAPKLLRWLISSMESIKRATPHRTGHGKRSCFSRSLTDQSKYMPAAEDRKRAAMAKKARVS